jgi:hypothetical protein
VGFNSDIPKTDKLERLEELLHMRHRSGECYFRNRDKVPGQALGLHQAETPRNYVNPVNEGGNIYKPTHRPSLPTGDIPCNHFC